MSREPRRPSGLVAAVRRAGPLAVVGMVVNGFGVVVTVAVARLVTSREYGGLIQLFGVLLVLQMPGSALLVAVVRRVTGWEAAGEGWRVVPWAARIRRRGAVAVLVAAVVSVVARGAVARQLGLPGPGGVAEILGAGAVWAMLSVERGLLQAELAYPALARNLALEAAVKTVVVIGLVAAGLGVAGAAAGVLASVVVATLHGMLAVGRVLAGREPAGRPTPDVAPAAVGRRHELLADTGTALTALALLALLQTLDVIILGREAPGASGGYAAVSVTSKSLVFLAIVLAGYLLPEAASRHHRGEHALRQLAVAAGLIGVPAAGLLAIASVGARPFLAVFFGSRLAHASGALAPLVLAMTFLATTLLCTNYLLGVGRARVVALLGAGVIALAAALVAVHGRPVATARADLACQAALAATAVAMVWRVPRGGRTDPVPSPR